ncbi:MAG: hypothetical protein KKC30_08380 [Proteobacteria bacterium]|nr:hypothetical protein [Pseudomonadota bacterium]MBU4382340.1 hypothetical protein [Pseudomonadota bacterium]MBU4605816.1 hypothetical protein [Pseudomonadota bacterium]MCG2766004.1 hypothetical protein [Desulfarculaceae bacterium]
MLQIMVVESDPSLARLYREELEDAGFRVEVRSDLRRALRTLEGAPAHVLVTNLDLVGGRLENWMDHLRQVHEGGVVLLGRHCRRPPPIEGLSVLDKSSDLSDLVDRLRDMANTAWWQHTGGNC